MANGERNHTNDHDLLIEINTKLGILLDQFHDHKEKAIAEMTRLDNDKLSKSTADRMTIESQKTHEDFEKRIRRLERWGLIAVGALTALQIILPYIEV